MNVNVYIAKQFTENERTNIINGILMWQRATNSLLRWKLIPYDNTKPLPLPAGRVDDVEERTVLFQRASSTDAWVIEWDAKHEDKKKPIAEQVMMLGVTQNGDDLGKVAKVWLVENRLTTDGLETITAAHEFGHAVGLDHVADKKSTMSKKVGEKDNKCITQHDLVEFCDKHDCNPNGLAEACKL